MELVEIFLSLGYPGISWDIKRIVSPLLGLQSLSGAEQPKEADNKVYQEAKLDHSQLHIFYQV